MKHRNNLISGIVFAVALAAVAFTTSRADASGVCGDFNDNSAITITDTFRHLQAVAGQGVTLNCPKGLSCWDLNENGVCDAGEDANGDGRCSVYDCQGSTDATLEQRVADLENAVSNSSTPSDPACPADCWSEDEQEIFRQGPFAGVEGDVVVNTGDIDTLRRTVGAASIAHLPTQTINGALNESYQRLDQCNCAPFLYDSKDRVVFVSSQVYDPRKIEEQFNSADDKCQELADASDYLKGTGTYRAWISTNHPSTPSRNRAPATDFDDIREFRTTGQGITYINVYGHKITTPSDIANGKDLELPISVDEKGHALGGEKPVWTGTTRRGFPVPATGNATNRSTCGNWGLDNDFSDGAAGDHWAVNQNWSARMRQLDVTGSPDGFVERPCRIGQEPNYGHLYCFQVTTTAPSP